MVDFNMRGKIKNITAFFSHIHAQFRERKIAKKPSWLYSPVITACYALIVLVFIIVFLSHYFYDLEFYKNVLVESHGLLMELAVFGTLFVWLDQKRKKRDDKIRLIESIEDLKSWRSEESACKVYGAYKRLQELGIRYDLSGYFLGNIHHSKADFRCANLLCSDLSSGFFHDSDFRFAYLRWAHLEAADLSGSDFRGANLYKADLSKTNLTDTNFSQNIIQETILNRAIFNGANFTDAFVIGVDLSDCVLEGGIWDRTCYLRVKFPNGFDPKVHKMIHIEDESYEHQPSIELIRNEKKVLAEKKALDKVLGTLSDRESLYKSHIR